MNKSTDGKSAKYSKIDDGKSDGPTKADNMGDFDDSLLDDGFATSRIQDKKKEGKRDHELYSDTYYLPNDKIRLLEIPVNSSLTF